MAFPVDRPRRLRRTEAMRSFVRETRLTPEGFVYPLFVCPGEGIRKEVRSMPGVYNLSIDEAVKECAEVKSLGIPGVILFGLPETKDEVATGAWAEDGIVQKATRAIKREVPGLLLMGDVCLCEYMSHGHCGLVDTSDPNAKALREAVAFTRELESKGKVVIGAAGVKSLKTESLGAAIAAATGVVAPAAEEYEILNDATLELLARTAVSQAKAGMDIIAPSDMMDGRVTAIRTALDENGFQNIPILSYAAKFASGFYGPFREAADSAPHFGDRRSYQMDPANLREAMREIELDLEEGADMIMVKPAMPYLDVLHEARLRFDVPLSAYQVSGEFAMIKAAALNGWIDYERVMMESLLCIQRAGASITLTYFAKEAARLLG
jgi:porphobilinogen synthase